MRCAEDTMMAVDMVNHTDRVDAYRDPPLAHRGNALSRRTLRDGSLGGSFPGTSCQATIVKSLRDAAATLKMAKLQRALQSAAADHSRRRRATRPPG